jgi:hypothetical protein
MIASRNDALKTLEAVEANLSRLEALWSEIEPLLPEPRKVATADPEKYIEQARIFRQFLGQIPAIDGYELQYAIMEPDEIATTGFDVFELDEFPATVSFVEQLHKQGDLLREYRFKLESKRRTFARQSVRELCESIDSQLQDLKKSARRLAPHSEMPKVKWEKLKAGFREIDALLGKSIKRPERWSDMARHLHFGMKGDFNDIVKLDWPSITGGLERNLYGDQDPLPVSVSDIGELVGSKPSGPVAIELQWKALSPGDFERLIFNIISKTGGYEQPQWLTHTNAPDRGRDLSAYRVDKDPLSGPRRTRIIFACKHVSSVNGTEVGKLRNQMEFWDQPPVDDLVIVTTGRFTNDAVQMIEKHNQSNHRLRIQMWPNSHLEGLLAERPELIAQFRLRT